MAKSNPYTPEWLRQQGMIEVSPGLYEKQSAKKIEWKQKMDITRDNIKVEGQPVVEKEKECIKINMKPMSVNGAWQGRRFKSKEYIAYTDSCLSILPNITLPEPPYRINFIFGVSNTASDWDNPVKPIQDILQQRYKFNDKEIYEAFVRKVIVPKRQEFFSFEILHLEL